MLTFCSCYSLASYNRSNRRWLSKSMTFTGEIKECTIFYSRMAHNNWAVTLFITSVKPWPSVCRMLQTFLRLPYGVLSNGVRAIVVTSHNANLKYPTSKSRVLCRNTVSHHVIELSNHLFKPLILEREGFNPPQIKFSQF